MAARSLQNAPLHFSHPLHCDSKMEKESTGNAAGQISVSDAYISDMVTFGTLLRNRRKACQDPETGRALSQERLVHYLSKFTGLRYERVSVSQWERDEHKIHHAERGLLVGLLQVLHRCGGVKDVATANELLFTGDYRDLNEEELRTVNPEWIMPLRANALPTPAVQLAALPAAPSPHVDISAETNTLIAMYEAGTTVAGLIGVAGSGKSVLATAVARQMIEHGQFQQVIQLLPHTDDAVEAVTEQLARQIFGRSDPDLATTQHAIQNYLRQQAYFIVIDGLEMVPTALWEIVMAWAQPTCFLVTGRTRPDFPAISTHMPPIWSRAVAVDYVRKLAQRQQITQTLDDALLAELCAFVGNNPKALALIPTFMTRRSADQLRDALQYSRDLSDLYTTMTATTWATLDQPARALLLTLCLVTEAGASEELLQTVSGLARRQFWRSLETLEKHMLVVSHADRPGWFYTHRLVAHFVLEQDAAALTTQATAMLDYWQRRFARLAARDWHVLVEDRPNIFHAVSLFIDIADDGTPLLSLLPMLTQFAERYGLTRALQLLLGQAVSMLSLNSAQRAQLLLLHGMTQRLNFAWSDAVETLQSAIVLFEQTQDKAHHAQALWEMASALKGQGKIDSAEKTVQEAHTRFQALNDTHGIGRCNNLLGLLAYERNAYSEAETFLQRAIDGLTGRDRANAHANYAATLQTQDKLTAAHEQYDIARALYEQEGSTLDRIRLMISAASLYAKQGEWAQAETLFAAIDIKSVPNVRTQAFYWWNFGRLAADQKAWAVAQIRLEACVAAWQAVGDVARLERAKRKLSQTIAEQRK